MVKLESLVLKLLVLEILPNLEMWEHPLREILADYHQVILVQVRAVTWVDRHQEMLSMGALLQAMCLHREMGHRSQMGLMDLLQEMDLLLATLLLQEMWLLQEMVRHLPALLLLMRQKLQHLQRLPLLSQQMQLRRHHHR